MRLILFALLLSFANGPGVLYALDGSHSIVLLSEHGVEHLVFFHRADVSEGFSDKYSAPQSSDDHPEVHLSPLTELIPGKIQVSTSATDIFPATEPVYTLKKVQTHSVSAFDPDIGSAQSPFSVLRI